MSDRRAQQAKGQVRAVIDLLNRLLVTVEHPGGKTTVLDEVYRRGSLLSLPDGYPARTLPETNVSGGGGTSSVESSAFLRNGWGDHPAPTDTVRAEAEKAHVLILRLTELADDLDRSASYVYAAGKFRCEKHLCSCDSHWPERSCSVCGCRAPVPVGLQGSACEGCERHVKCTAADPLRGGYCNACRMAWERAGRPLPGLERDRFNESRRERRRSA